MAFELQCVLINQAYGQQILTERKAPAGQPSAVIQNLHVADAGMIVVRQQQALAERPFAPRGFARRAGQQAPVGEDNQALDDGQRN